MTDDFSNLVTGASCYAISNQTTIYSYKANIRTSYVQIGGKWFKQAEQVYQNVPASTTCYSYADITKINSNAPYYPIYQFLALVLAVFVWFFVFRLYSRLIRWRV